MIFKNITEKKNRVATELLRTAKASSVKRKPVSLKRDSNWEIYFRRHREG